MRTLGFLVTQAYHLLNESHEAGDRFIAYKTALRLMHFHTRPHINSIEYFRDLRTLNIGMDCFTLILYSKSGRART